MAADSLCECGHPWCENPGRIIEAGAWYVVMFHHPAMQEDVWRPWGRAATGIEAKQRLAEAQEERPEYTFRLAVRRTTLEWADDE